MGNYCLSEPAGNYTTDAAFRKLKFTQLVTGMMKKPLGFQNTLVRGPYADADISFLPSGAFALAFRLTLGTQWIRQLVARLKAIERLQVMLRILKRKEFHVDSSGLSHVLFAYAQDLKVEVIFGEDSPLRTRFIPATNPHRRIRFDLEALVKDEPHDRGFTAFADALITTLPLLQAFDDLESAKALQPHPSTASPTAAPSSPPQHLFQAIVHPRSWMQYRIRFTNCTFDVHLRPRRGSSHEWHVTIPPSIPLSRTGQAQSSVQTPQDLTQRLRDFAKEAGNGWKGLRGSRPSWAASVDGVQELVKRIDEIVEGCGTPDQGEGNGNGVKGEPDAA